MMKKEEDRKHPQKKLGGHLQPFDVEFTYKMKPSI